MADGFRILCSPMPESEAYEAIILIKWEGRDCLLGC